MTTSRWLRLVAGVAVAAMVSGCTADRGRDDPPLRLISALRPFEACDEMLSYLRSQASELVGPWGLQGGSVQAFGLAERAVALDSAAPAAAGAGSGGDTAYSTTNVQEAGVDEPDLVKTDGKVLVSVVEGRLDVVDVAGPAPRLLGRLQLGNAAGGSAQLLLAGQRALVLEQRWDEVRTQRGSSPGVAASSVAPGYGGASKTRVTAVDISDPAAPKQEAFVDIDGSLVGARLVEGVARLVLRSGPPALPFVHPEQPERRNAEEMATAANRGVLARSSLDDWLPQYRYREPGRAESEASGRLVECDDVSRPTSFSGLSMVSVVAIDPADLRPGPAATVVGAGDVVYASAANLYVTTTAVPAPSSSPDGEPSTAIHQFAIADPVRTRYVASGAVPGHLLNQFSLSEHDGVLRVATTIDRRRFAPMEPVSAPDARTAAPPEGREPVSESRVTTLRQRDGVLVEVGALGGLGKTERIYSVRFIGDRGYVVTFRQVDPLYVLDMADAAQPRLLGELKIPGYSAYLHPAGDHRLIGIGQDATEEGRVQGTQLSYFDVSDPATPKRIGATQLAGAHSEAEYDHHAFLYWPATKLVLVPVELYGQILPLDRSAGSAATPEAAPQPFVGAVAFTVDDGGVREVGRVAHPGNATVRRSLVVGDRVLTLSQAGLLTSDLTTLRQVEWLAL